MPPKKRPDADRLPISQRIDSRMPNPGPAQDECDQLGDQRGAVFELFLHGFLPLCCVAGRASSDRRRLPGVDGDCH